MKKFHVLLLGSVFLKSNNIDVAMATAEGIRIGGGKCCVIRAKTGKRIRSQFPVVATLADVMSDTQNDTQTASIPMLRRG